MERLGAKVACRLGNPMLRPRGVGAGDAESTEESLGWSRKHGEAENMGLGYRGCTGRWRTAGPFAATQTASSSPGKGVCHAVWMASLTFEMRRVGGTGLGTCPHLSVSLLLVLAVNPSIFPCESQGAFHGRG